jgi:hypothetical protein
MEAARRLIKGDAGPVDEQALAAFGLPSVERPDSDIVVWPENEKTVEVFIAMGTQWNVGMNGAIGLRYESLPAVMRYCAVPNAERGDAFAGLRIMERAALEEMRRG